MFSVVIPLYNKELSIKNTIQSVLNQSYQNFEIIVVNDGSTDCSEEIVRKLNDKRIRIFVKENGGVSSARNFGIREAKYDWIAFLDGDDLWDINHLMEYYNVIIENPKINWLTSGFRTYYNDDVEKINIYSKEGVIRNVLLEYCNGLVVHTSSVIVRREIFSAYNDMFFREGMNNSEDREVWYKLAIVDKSPYYIRKCLSSYDMTQDINSLTKKITVKSNLNFLSMKKRLQEFGCYSLLENVDKKYIDVNLRKFNRKALLNIYIRENEIIEEGKMYFTSLELFILKKTKSRILKKVLIRLL